MNTVSYLYEYAIVVKSHSVELSCQTFIYIDHKYVWVLLQLRIITVNYFI